MPRFLDLPNAVTLAGLLSALAAVFLAVSGAAHLAFAALVVSGVCDLIDGPLARRAPRSDEERAFGGHLDSLADACAFGFAPAAALYAMGHRSPIEVVPLALLAAAAVWRLAWFETVAPASGGAAPGATTGLPVTYVALFVPLAGLFHAGAPALARPLLAGTVLLLAILMVSPLRIPRPRGLWYAVFVAAAVAIGGLHVAAHLLRK